MSKRSLSSKVKAALKAFQNEVEVQPAPISAKGPRPLSEEEIREWGHVVNIIAKMIDIPATSVEARLLIVMIGALLTVRCQPSVLYQLIKEAFPKELALALLLLKDEAREVKLGKPQSH